MVFLALYVSDKALREIEKASKKPYPKRKLLVGDYKAKKVINNIIGGK